MRSRLILLVAAMILAGCQTRTPLEAQQSPGSQDAPLAGTKTPSPTPTAAKAIGAKPRAARPTASAEEQTIFDLANRERAAHNLPALKWNAALASAARGHAQKMAQAGTLSHQFAGEMDMGMRFRLAGVRFSTAAENVALGPTPADVHREWMNSPSHRDNILDPGLDSLGVAVVARNGQLFAVQDFALAAQ